MTPAKSIRRKKTPRGRFTVSLPMPLIADLDELVADRGTDRSKLVGAALRPYLARIKRAKLAAVVAEPVVQP